MSIGVGADLEIRPATAADTDAILELVRLSLGVGPIPRERRYWDWKHRQNPFGESPMLIAEAAGQLVGLRVFMRWEWRSGDQVVPAVRAVDTATHPDWQGRGIFRRLTLALVERMQQEGVGFVFNTPNDQSRPGYLKMGWHAVGRTDLWLRPLRPLQMARVLAARGRLEDTASVSEPSVDRFPTARSVLSDPTCDAFLERLAVPSSGSRLTTPKTAPYLLWRYADVPGFDYGAVAELHGEDGALILFRYKAQGAFNELRIVDLLVGASASSRRIARRLLRRLHADADADYVSAMAPARSQVGMTLAGGGYLPVPRTGPILTVRPLSMPTRAPDPLRRSSWAASIGDLELF